MSIYSPNSVWGLATDYNMRRGQILDGSRVATTLSFGWKKGEKHGVDDESVHYKIQKFLETQPQKRASIVSITATVLRAAGHPEQYLRELKKQLICEHVA